MSYILDALRKADAERERGAVPSIHTQSRRMPDFDDEDPGHARGIPSWAWLVLGLSLAALLAGGWWQFGASSEPAAVAAASSTPPLPALPVTPPVSPPSLEAPSRAMPVPQRQQSAEGPKNLPSPPKAVPPRPRAMPPKAAPAVAAAAEKLLDQTQVVKFAALNPALKRELPTMTLGGAMYSPDARARMVIINGQVKREGEDVAPGLTVRRIRANTVVFEYKGQLFEMLV